MSMHRIRGKSTDEMGLSGCRSSAVHQNVSDAKRGRCSDTTIVDTIVQESGVPNAVAGIIFRNRLYDTIFEVVVFSIAILGAKFCWPTSNLPAPFISSPTSHPLSLPS
jgi:hypothetical protein